MVAVTCRALRRNLNVCARCCFDLLCFKTMLLRCSTFCCWGLVGGALLFGVGYTRRPIYWRRVRRDFVFFASNVMLFRLFELLGVYCIRRCFVFGCRVLLRYTTAFCTAVFKSWLKGYKSVLMAAARAKVFKEVEGAVPKKRTRE